MAARYRVASALAGRCPRCGQGRLLRGLLSVRSRCRIGGLELAARDSGDSRVAFVIPLAGMIRVGAALVVEVGERLPVWLHLLLSLPTLLSLAPMRPFKPFLLGRQFRHRSEDFDRAGGS